MEHYEEVVLRTVENAPRFWKGFVDDTFLIQHTEHKVNFLDHIKKIDQTIKFIEGEPSQIVSGHSWTL